MFSKKSKFSFRHGLLNAKSIHFDYMKLLGSAFNACEKSSHTRQTDTCGKHATENTILTCTVRIAAKVEVHGIFIAIDQSAGTSFLAQGSHSTVRHLSPAFGRCRAARGLANCMLQRYLPVSVRARDLA